MCGFVGDVIGGIVDVIGSVAEFVIDNALPIITTVAMNYIAPGFGSYLSTTFNLSKEVGLMVAKGIGSAAVSAINGGSLANIATAGLTPFLPSIASSLGLPNINPTGFINSAIKDVLGDNFVSNIISNAVGDATMAGVTAVVTGADILEAAGMAGLSGAVGAALGQTWNTLKENAPTLKNIEDSITNLLPSFEANKPIYEKLDAQKTPSIQAELQKYNSDLVNSVNKYNNALEFYNANKPEYDSLFDTYTSNFDLYESAKARNDNGAANNYAREANAAADRMKVFSDPVNNSYKEYFDITTSLSPEATQFINDYKSYAREISLVDQINSYQSQYDVLTKQIQADYSQLKMTEAITQGDYTKAAEFNKQFNTYNKDIAKVDPNATVGSYLNPTQASLLNSLGDTTDTATQQQLISRMKLDSSFADIKVPEVSKPNFTPYQPKPPTTSTTSGTSNAPTYGSTYDTSNDPMQKYGNAQVKLAQAIDNKDYASAATYNAELKALETQIKANNPNAVIPQSILANVDEANILDKIATAKDATTKQQFIDQAKRLPSFSGVAYDTESAYQQALQQVPETGIGQPTPPAPTTPTTPSVTPNIGNYLTNVVPKVLENVTKGVVTNQVINAILGNDPQRPSLPTKPRPPSKVDVSTLKPFTGDLPSNVTASVTPEKKDPKTLTPFTGGLPTTGGTTTTPTTPNTSTQTPTGGLQSNQTQTPPTKVDVSKLTPVTDMNWLKSLGIA
jgi:hypothetical protein